MLDIALIREKAEWVKAQIEKLNDPGAVDHVDAVVELDVRRRELLTEAETLRAERNTVSKQIGKMKDKAERDAKIAEMRAVGDRIDALDAELSEVEEKLNEHMLWVPNLPDESVPVGESDEENILGEPHGALPKFDFEPQPHWDLGPALDIIDFERGVKLSGSRFYVLYGMGSRLQRALINFFLDMHINEHGYTEVWTPYMVREEMMVGAAQFPKFRQNVYRDAEEDYCFLPTAEVSVTNLHRDEILDAAQLPMKYVAYSACFRREKMSAGRDVRGIKRLHQFFKVEMYRFTQPEQSYQALEEMVENATAVCDRLGLPWRLVEMVTGDLGFAAAKKYDIEVWAAGCQEWLEVSSLSNCEAFQARRANVRYRPEPGAPTQFVHTLNGSGLALPRIMIALLENNQREDGSIILPDVLASYMGGQTVITPQG